MGHIHLYPNTTHLNLVKSNMQVLLVIAALACSALCMPQNRFQSAPVINAVNDFQEPYQLSSGAFDIFGNVQSSFSCEGRIYGFYANEELNCQIFHVCEPVSYPDGRQETIQYNFFCGNQTVFDQSLLVCNHVADAIPCSESSSFHSINQEFGRIPDYDIDFRNSRQ